jgi:penicillin-binding protein 1A
MVSILQGVVQRGTGASSCARSASRSPARPARPTTIQRRLVHRLLARPRRRRLVGFDQPQTLGAARRGARNAAPIFRDFMSRALDKPPGSPFRIPPGIRLVRVNRGDRAARPSPATRVILEAFKPGTEPNRRQQVVVTATTADHGVRRRRAPAAAGGGTAGSAAARGRAILTARRSSRQCRPIRTKRRACARDQAVAEEIRASLALLRRHL